MCLSVLHLFYMCTTSSRAVADCKNLHRICLNLSIFFLFPQSDFAALCRFAFKPTVCHRIYFSFSSVSSTPFSFSTFARSRMSLRTYSRMS